MNLLIYTPRAFSLSETFIYNIASIEFENLYKIIACNYSIDEIDLDEEQMERIIIASKPVNFYDRAYSFFFRLIYRLDHQYVISYFGWRRLERIFRTAKVDLVHIHYGPSAIAIFPLLKLYRIPYIIHFHGYDASKLLADVVYISNLAKVAKKASALIVVSEEMKSNLTSIGILSQKIVKIPYGVDLSFFSPTEKVIKDSIRILHVGRLVQKKGVPDLITVFYRLQKEFDNIELIVIGDGEEYRICLELIENYKLGSKIKMLGATPAREIPKYLNEADIFVLNSRVSDSGDKEGLPNVILEAMACKCAVVSTYHGGIPEAVVSLEDGLLVAEKDNDQLLDALKRLICDEDLRARLVENAYTKVVKHYSIEAMQRAIGQLYKEIVA